MTFTSAESVDLAAQEAAQRFLTDPFPELARLRAEDPLHATGPRTYLLTRYEDVARFAAHDACSSEAPSARLARSGRLGAGAESFSRALVSRDAPAHTELKRILSQHYTQQAVTRLRPRMEQIADALLDSAGLIAGAGHPARGLRLDLGSAVAEPFPYLVNCAVLGLSPDSFAEFRPWIRAIELAARPSSGRAERRLGDEAIVAFREWILDLRGRSVLRPGSLLEKLLTHANENPSRGDLTAQDFVDNAKALLVAGAEETTALITSAVLEIATKPDLQSHVRDQPEAVRELVEGVLRDNSPIKTAYRWAARDLEVQGRMVRAGEALVLSLAGANRDDQSPRSSGHLAFGKGRHRCLGAQLARLEARVIVQSLLGRCGSISLGQPVRYRPSAELRQVEELVIRVELPQSRGRDRCNDQ